MNACGKLAASLRQACRKLAKLNFNLYKLAASLRKLASILIQNSASLCKLVQACASFFGCKLAQAF
ncbi:hypothetical protein DPMN_154113 [Dreissena polymorpha]|uniref:Uncharacterized protein n=1 Tax=Dreissena polymorpha TaxID=45954 RepID=A0A9D4J6P4_DREPO|nr:hypothetical protein DPMN_154113 [Dreissena polymorpha]